MIERNNIISLNNSMKQQSRRIFLWYFQVFLCKFAKVLRNLFYRTPLGDFLVSFFSFFFLVIHFSGLLGSEDAIYMIMRKRFPASDKLGEALTVELGLI